MHEFVFYAAAILFFIYGMTVKNAGTGTMFYTTWFLLGLLTAALGIAFHMDLWKYIPPAARHIVLLLSSVLLLLFVIVEGCIIRQFSTPAQKNLDYIIVLGAHVTKTGPKPVLRYRLDAAYDYLMDNPGTTCILSGGQGKNEPFSEARGMEEYLQKRGIPKERLILEALSQNTHQNLINSSAFFDKDRDSIGIVTNNFHMFRSIHLAKRLGFRHVYGVASPSNPVFLPNNLLREFFAVCKDAMIGNLK